MTMQPFKAHVRNGRPDLPEGDVVELVLLDGGDELDDEERARLDEALLESIDQMKAGQTVDAAEALAELRAHR